jgi:hypothetical protein
MPSAEIPQVVFIVPYRDREQQYLFFDRHMKQVVMANCGYNYKILYVHQCDARSFNRGALKNIGFLWVRSTYPNDYRNITLVFNDVDNMPFTGGFLHYPTTTGVVKHFYGFLFALGGIFSITAGDFERVGGFPNFWAWGFEDNLIQRRCLSTQGIVIDRSQFYNIFDKNIMHFLDGMTRSVNRTEYDLYMARYKEGWSAIRDLQYDYDESKGFLNVRGFLTESEEDKAKTMTYDLRKGIHPFPSNKRRGRVGAFPNFKWAM